VGAERPLLELSLRFNRISALQLPAHWLASFPADARVWLEGNDVEVSTPAQLAAYVDRLRAKPRHLERSTVMLWGSGAHGKSTLSRLLAGGRPPPRGSRSVACSSR
jgi:hypothetical protein